MSTNPAFEQWFARVAREMNLLCGMGPDDLPDYDYWSAFEDGENPCDCAEMAVAAAKDY